MSALQSTNRPIDDVAFMAEFKHESGDDPFKDHTPGFEHDSDRSERTLGQICAYATAHMAAQFRSEVFSLLIFPKYARILRWDRAGVIVTGRIEFGSENSGASLLADFFWRYQNMTRAQRGHDEDITRVTLEYVENLIPGAVATLGANRDSPFFAVRFPDGSEFLITKPTYMGVGSPTGRSTRTFKALCVETKKLVFLKDTWRVIHPGILPEHVIYSKLASKGISHVATLVTHHDMANTVTRTKDFAQEEWVRFNGPSSFRTFQHCRLVLREVGRPLQSFRNLRELIQVFRDALQAHRMAHDMANILHRDISAGNIMITEEGRGLLVDWDLSKSLVNASEAPSPPERTGTWQFMAARLIVNRTPETPLPIPNREDDLESFWHVLLWIALRHCDHRANPMFVVKLLSSLFDSKYVGETGYAQGGDHKLAFLTSQSTVRDIGVVSKVLRTILVKTAKVLAIRYPSDETEDEISQVQRIWEQLQLENSTSDKQLLTLRQHIFMDSPWLMDAYSSWRNWRTIQDNVEWMEEIFENTLQDPSTDWNTGNANVPHILPQPSAPKGPKRKNDSDIDGRKPKKVSNLESLPE